MKKIIILIFTVIFVLTMAITAFAGSTITVSGSGEALVPADTAIISLGVTARDKDVLNAQGKVNSAIAEIKKALIEYGVAKEDINTDYINIYAMYDYVGDTEELAAYNANSTLAIRTKYMDSIGEIIDIAFEAGANMLNNINFSATDTTEAEEKALHAAVEDASRKADILSEASGLKISGIDSITEGGTYSFDMGAANNFMKEAAVPDTVSGTVVQAAKLTVTANITVTYSVEED